LNADDGRGATVDPAVRRVRWQQACRIVPTRYPAITLFDRVADAEDFEALYALEALSNERARDELGQIERVPREQRLYGPGSGPIMAAFTHVNLLGSRFADGRHGVFYAARERATAVAETRHHHGLFLATTHQGPMHLPMRLYSVTIDARLHDLRPVGAVPAAVHDPDDYSAARALGHRLHGAGSAGMAYRSVRHPGGQCVGLFRPRGASACVHSAYLLYAWDGAGFSDIYEKFA
jgi:RES domain